MPNPPPRLLPLTRALLTLALVLDVVAVLGGFGLDLTALLAPERLRYDETLAALTLDERARAVLIAGSGLAIAAALMFFVLLQLRQLVDTAIDGDPFRAENGRRLRRIAWLIFGV